MATYCPQLLPKKSSTNTDQIKKSNSDKMNTAFTVATWNDAKDAYSKMKNILTNSKTRISTKLKLLVCYIFPFLTYGPESWTISKEMKKNAEMSFLGKIMKISLNSLKQFGYEKRRLLKIIRRGQLKFFGHIMRKERMENLTTTGKIAGRKDREIGRDVCGSSDDECDYFGSCQFASTANC
ncbi:hypothetical protein HELRODRAFT_161350 [Helobdella robusta]|uniref:Reverse transcriptase domain-containing protein n=1 Tax=Helobdella robusta TaxID=6412 RepID=T1ERD6_HELRO|nr:hypothetical protein HELRODRAFT_161350 [Helobdella robusta]ESO02114.1 hypothetical protein HELRODRAFT_161350 [Helobdella robusta]